MNAPAFIDFPALKEQITIHQAMQMLGLKMKNENGAFRGACPTCKSGGDRALVITPAKGAYYCFAQKRGGDQVALVAHVKGVSQKEAATAMIEHFGMVTGKNSTDSTIPRNNSPQPQGRELKPLDYLTYTEAVAALGVSEATCSAWGAGFAPKGIMRGRLAIPLHDRTGTLVAYCGRTVKEESPVLTFPNGFDPHSLIFAAERVQPGPLYLVRDPLQVLTAFEAGMENVVAFLTETISAQQLEMLASLMDEKKSESVELY